MEWSEALKITPSSYEGYDYNAVNISSIGIEILAANQNIIFLAPGNFVAIKQQDLVTTLQNPVYNGKCSNAFLQDGEVVVV